MSTAAIIHKFRDNEYLDGDPPIFSCTCGHTGPRNDVIRHVADMEESNDALLRGDALLRAQQVADLSHELKLAAITWSKADEAAEDAGAALDGRAADIKAAAAIMPASDPGYGALVRRREAAHVELTWACQREDQALERMKAIAKKLTQMLEKT